jgi:hypothetical protein
MGRPVVYTQRSIFTNRIIALKYKFQLAFPAKEDFIDKEDNVLVDILIQMETDIAILKLNRRMELLELKKKGVLFKEIEPLVWEAREDDLQYSIRA